MRGGHVRIGVLGGIGPEATGTFYLKLMRRLQELGCVSRNGDYPQVIVNSIPAREFPERVDPSISIDDVDPMYSQGLLELDAAGVDFIAMACNTVHLFHRELQSRVRAPVIDLREAVRAELLRRNIRRYVVLGTPWTIEMGLYDFEDEGLEVLRVDPADLEVLYGAIYSFNVGRDVERGADALEHIARRYLGAGADVVILGCTEVSLMLSGRALPSVDTMDVLVDATVERFCAMRDGRVPEDRGRTARSRARQLRTTFIL
ncbi:MAG: aspartate/glutamate racemase family protein [Conexivisphaera sp.]